MIHNRTKLIDRKPVVPFVDTKVSHNGVSHGLTEAGYDLRINQDVYFNSLMFGLIRWTTVVEDSGKKTRRWGRFALASTRELFTMPSYLVGVVHDKSTWARKGLSVFNTVVEPKWKGFLTLELVNHSSKRLHIKRGSGIAQILFHELSEAGSYQGKYSNQPNWPVEAKES